MGFFTGFSHHGKTQTTKQLFFNVKKYSSIENNNFWIFSPIELGPWTKWTECSTTCGGGTQRRTRECGLLSKGTNNPCKQTLIEVNKCNVLPCPSFGPWSSWSPCSVTCGGGNQTRMRECLPPNEVTGGSAAKQRIQQLYCEGKSLQSQVIFHLLGNIY